MWDAEVVAQVDEIVRTVVTELRQSSAVLGYYADNELGWWNATLIRMTLEMPSTSEQRRRVVSFLRRHYSDTWERLLRDFDPEGAHSFEEFAQHGTLFLRPGANGARVYRRILAMLADRYYSVTTKAIRKYTGNALVLGDRYQSFYYPEVARAARRYVDVVSTNLNAHWIDGSFSRYYLRTLHEITGKPVQIGEFYMCAEQNRSGDPNTSAGFPVVATQAERAAGFVRTLTQAASLPYVVGADWFQYYDEPPHGRGDGEDYNMGLVDINDVPYEEITTAAKMLDVQALHSAAKAPAASGHCVPYMRSDPLESFTHQHAMNGWDRNAGFIQPSTKAPVADLYACWTDEALYLGMNAMGMLEDAAYRSGAVPECDRSLWLVRCGKPVKGVCIRFGSGRDAVSSDPEVRAITAKGEEGAVCISVAARLPAKLFGAGALEPGMTLPIDVTLDTAGRCDHVRWRTRLTLQGP